MNVLRIAGALLIILAMAVETGLAKNPKGFALFRQELFKEYPHFHGGAGTIRYAGYWGPEDYRSQHQFLRVAIIPPKAGIGEYRLTDSDETFALVRGRAYVTVNGRTGHIAGMTLIPVSMGSSVGLYNPTDEDISLIWVCSVKEKGRYNPLDLGNDLAAKLPEKVIPFPSIAQNYFSTEPGRSPSHRGLGQGLIENLETVDFGWFRTGYHTRWFAVPPHSSIGYHKHFTNEEHFFVVSGSARGTVNNVTVRMGPLDCLKCGIDDSHGIYNDGDENLWLFFTNQPMPGVTGWGKVEDIGDAPGGREVNWVPQQ
ncbi:MAG: cupin domain-containing protein [Candidatus Latescibacterota bacterium]